MRLNTLQGKSSFILTNKNLQLLFSHGRLIAVRDERDRLIYVRKTIKRDESAKHLELFNLDDLAFTVMPDSWFNELAIQLPVKH